MSNIVKKSNEIVKSHIDLKEMFVNFRLMLVRNYEDLPFVSAMNEDCRNDFEEDFISFILRKKKNLIVTNTDDLSKEKMLLLYSRGLWLQELDEGKNTTFIYNEAGDTAIILNFQNHVTILVSTYRQSLKQAYRKLTELEKKVGEFSKISASEDYGYISPQLKYCGLGFKITALMHSVWWAGNMRFLESGNEETVSVVESIQEDIFNRGYQFDESYIGKVIDCDAFYEVSSRFNLGVTEQELMERFMKGLKKFVEQEENAVNIILNESSELIIDKIYRSYGLLKYARLLGLPEAIHYCANLRLGLKMKLPIPVDLDLLNSLQQAVFDFDLSNGDKENFAKRAQVVRLLLEEDDKDDDLKGDDNAK